eukprot:gene31109-39031_t
MVVVALAVYARRRHRQASEDDHPSLAFSRSIKDVDSGGLASYGSDTLNGMGLASDRFNENAGPPEIGTGATLNPLCSDLSPNSPNAPQTPSAAPQTRATKITEGIMNLGVGAFRNMVDGRKSQIQEKRRSVVRPNPEAVARESIGYAGTDLMGILSEGAGGGAFGDNDGGGEIFSNPFFGELQDGVMTQNPIFGVIQKNENSNFAITGELSEELAAMSTVELLAEVVAAIELDMQTLLDSLTDLPETHKNYIMGVLDEPEKLLAAMAESVTFDQMTSAGEDNSGITSMKQHLIGEASAIMAQVQHARELVDVWHQAMQQEIVPVLDEETAAAYERRRVAQEDTGENILDMLKDVKGRLRHVTERSAEQRRVSISAD